jgi:hypothetical protein
VEEINCPNFDVCKLVSTAGFTGDEARRLRYMETYCKAGERHWGSCTRLVVKKALNFCPDFVLPDTAMTPDEVIDRFDAENMAG